MRAYRHPSVFRQAHSRGFSVYQGFDLNYDDIVVSGIGMGLPNTGKSGEYQRVFDKENVRKLLHGNNYITPLTEQEKLDIVDKNITLTLKGKTEPITRIQQVIQLAGRIDVDFAKEFKIPKAVSEIMDASYKLAVGSGLQAMEDAGLIGADFKLRDEHREDTGVIMGSCYPVIDSVIDELSKYMSAKFQRISKSEIQERMENMAQAVGDQFLRQDIDKWLSENAGEAGSYEYNKKFLMKVTVLGNSQLAYLTGAEGPNTLINSACASTTQAVGIASDWITLGRAKRVVVIAGDQITSPNLLPWVGAGFFASGAASIESDIHQACRPFDRVRTGVLLGAGGVSLVVEAKQEVLKRKLKPKAKLIATHFCNSAGHAVRIDNEHVSMEMEKFVAKIQKILNISRERLSNEMIYFSHETSTNASREASCAFSEIFSLKKVFGEWTSNVLVTNTKGYTGHAMGVAFEEAVSVLSLQENYVPKVRGLIQPDQGFDGIRFSKGEKHDRKYVLRFAGGFGSQVAFSFYEKYSE
eukprot:TRINITY_DN1986_c0_g1_i1.p1 TRINITY_DN1986_c0_g1~~TRINITY_DN1986_c0_g1_i1.p1  ORF type:complete len:525 (+),score=118.40 TRINITY_DN1986_c0_g1_i1:45-1619(+)